MKICTYAIWPFLSRWKQADSARQVRRGGLFRQHSVGSGTQTAAPDPGQSRCFTPALTQRCWFNRVDDPLVMLAKTKCLRAAGPLLAVAGSYQRVVVRQALAGAIGCRREAVLGQMALEGPVRLPVDEADQRFRRN